MARPTIKLPSIDMTQADNKRRVIQSVGVLTGLYEVTIEPRRSTRSNQQNKWYWACLVRAFGEYMRDQDYDITSDDECHEFLKARFLATTVVNKTTGEVLGRRVKSTTELTTEQFSDYCERCRAWMADFFGIIVPVPEPFHSRTGETVKGLIKEASNLLERRHGN
jgi:hypothetical protein